MSEAGETTIVNTCTDRVKNHVRMFCLFPEARPWL